MFANKKITFIHFDGSEYNCKVIECIKNLGITIVDSNNQPIFCLYMPKHPKSISYYKSIDPSTHKEKKLELYKEFTKIKEAIRIGIVDVRKIYSKDTNFGEASNKTCPFSA
jgi:hypothetical protein